MSQNVPSLTSKQVQAAALLAADELSDEEIGASVGVSRKTLQRWRDIPEFLDLIAEHTRQVQATMYRLAIAKRHKRVEVLDDLQNKMLAIIDERALVMANDPDAIGGATGLIVKDIKAVGNGRNATLVNVYGFDAPLARELRANQEQAAKELGQWVEKSEQSGTLTNKVELVGVDAGDI